MKKVIFIIAFLGSVNIAVAQDFHGYYTASFDFNQPLSNTNRVNSMSILGVKFGYHRLFNQKFSMGGELNWGTYKQYHPTITGTQPNGTVVTTDYFDYVYAYGLVVSGRYMISYDNKINPYFGVALGAAYNKYAQFYNVYEFQKKALGFLARPEAGMIIRFSRLVKTCGLVGVHYDYSTTSSNAAQYSDFSNYGFNVGVIFLDW
ncbi:MAG TPA: hypothetical protein VIM65_22680 [Cyclobacteriaceae bacterium]